MTGIFASLGISKSDIDTGFGVLLTAANFYWAFRFNNLKFNDQMYKSLKDENDVQEQQIKKLKHELLVLKIKKRREEGASKGTE